MNENITEDIVGAIRDRNESLSAQLEDSTSTQGARETLAKAFREDPNFRFGYQSNIAMLLHDYFNKADFHDSGIRNEAASMILNLLFKE